MASHGVHPLAAADDAGSPPGPDAPDVPPATHSTDTPAAPKAAEATEVTEASAAPDAPPPSPQLAATAHDSDLAERNALLSTVLDHIDAHVFVKDRQGRFLYVNRSSAELFGVPADQIVNYCDADFFSAEILEPIHELDRLVFATRQTQAREERLLDRTGAARYFWSVKVPLIENGLATALIGLSTDITELHKLRTQLEHEASTDGLTGVANRRHFYEVAVRSFATAQAGPTPLSLLVLDFDFFKRINDTFGHQAGDHVLSGVAQRLAAGIRLGDFIGRVGGEEFAILLPDTDLANVRDVAEHLRATLADMSFALPGDDDVSITVSVGGTAVHAADPNFDACYARADAALYRAKAAGRNCMRLAGD